MAMTDEEVWGSAPPAAAPAASAPMSDEDVWGAPPASTFSSRVAERQERIGDRAVDKLQNPNLNDLGRASVDLQTGLNSMLAYPTEAISTGYDSLPDSVRGALEGAAKKVGSTAVDMWNAMPEESRAAISRDVKELGRMVGEAAYEHPNTLGLAENVLTLAPAAAGLKGVAAAAPVVGTELRAAGKGLEGLAEGYAKKYPEGMGPLDEMSGPKAPPKTPKATNAFMEQEARNRSYVEAMNAEAENMKRSYGRGYDMAEEIAKGVDINAPRMRENVTAMLEDLKGDLVHKTEQGSSQAFRDLEAVASAFDDKGNISLDKVTLLKRRLNDLYKSDMGTARGKIYNSLNQQINQLTRRARADNPEWADIMDSSNALFNNYRTSFGGYKRWLEDDKKAWEDAYSMRHGNKETGSAGDPYSGPPSDDVMGRMLDLHNVKNVAELRTAMRLLPDNLRQQFFDDAVAAAKANGEPRIVSALMAANKGTYGNYLGAAREAWRTIRPGQKTEPWYHPDAIGEGIPTNWATSEHTRLIDSAQGKYLEKLQAAQDAADAAREAAKPKLLEYTTKQPGPDNYGERMYRALPAPDPNDPRYPRIALPDGSSRSMTQAELEAHIAHQQGLDKTITRAERAAMQDRKASQEAMRMERARAAYEKDPLNQSNFSTLADEKLGIGAEREAVRSRDADFFNQRESEWPTYLEDIVNEERHPDDIGILGEEMRRAFPKKKFAHGGAVHADPNPTEAQKAAGNYKKGHIRLHGLDISIENPKGSKRKGIAKNGAAWECSMPNHYGYIRGTRGADKDHVDCYVGENERSHRVYIIDQKDAETGKFDEHKVMLNYSDRDAAVAAYRSAFSDKKNRIMKVTRMSIPEFKEWLKSGKTHLPVRKAA